jgi:hypothetical protein
MSLAKVWKHSTCVRRAGRCPRGRRWGGRARYVWLACVAIHASIALITHELSYSTISSRGSPDTLTFGRADLIWSTGPRHDRDYRMPAEGGAATTGATDQRRDHRREDTRIRTTSPTSPLVILRAHGGQAPARAAEFRLSEACLRMRRMWRGL